ncbi:cupin domain-containing protein [Streptomyces albidus (ex Kaewkla and Franco 2022)]|uniref:cupin domain-containing protein n=1 Tax=Streptomyces albidus (ex Kaewkla and Franco 2022) TaxID=722709 RepID=UPI0015EF0F4F|nr:cupin domain-containing protein [Streptomyces albidus (ex Kaewkla and Franco 2022)]
MSTGNALKVAAKDVPSTDRQGGEIKALLTPTSVGATDGFTGTMRIAPGDRVAEHYHPYSDEFVYVVEGALRVSVDGDEQEVASDEAVMFRRGQRHRLVNAGSTAAFLVYHISPLAPRPELGHVDTEKPPNPDSEPPQVGGPR